MFLILLEPGAQPSTVFVAGQLPVSVASQFVGLALESQYAPHLAITQPFQKSSPSKLHVPTVGA